MPAGRNGRRVRQALVLATAELPSIVGVDQRRRLVGKESMGVGDRVPENLSMKLLNLPEAAKFLRISKDKLRDLAAAGDVPGMKIGGQWRLVQERLEDVVLFQKKAWEADFEELTEKVTTLKAAIEQMRIAGGSAEFQKAFDRAKELL